MNANHLPVCPSPERITTLDDLIATFGPLSAAERGFWARQLKMSKMTRFPPGAPYRPKQVLP